MQTQGAKRALIVDDSRSARAFLSRILEKYQIEVDTAESAEAAMDYLAARKPDVIFMDHLMPGMDGFQAVQAIKNNPRTAAIPIMMYTSQEGDLYLGQARALGAAGVLPKQLKPADVSKVLYQLHLVPDRRSAEPGAFRPIIVGSLPDAPAELPAGLAAGASSGARPLTDAILREQFAELRRALVASLDTQSERLAADVRTAVGDALPPPPPAAVEAAPPKRAPAIVPWALAGLAVVALAAGAFDWQRQRAARSSSEARVAQLEQALAEAREEQKRLAATALEAAAAAEAAGASDAELVMQVPYGEEPLTGERLARVRGMLEQLATAGHRGALEVSLHTGRFCLAQNAGGTLVPASEDVLAARCEVFGNLAQSEGAGAERVPPELASFAAQVRAASGGALELKVMDGDPVSLAVTYPRLDGDLPAGEWNRVARANNRVEVRIR